MNKKILAIVLTAAILFSSAITAFAADTAVRNGILSKYLDFICILNN